MIWRVNNTKNYIIGDEVHSDCFAWWPTRIKDASTKNEDEYIIWLETYQEVQKLYVRGWETVHRWRIHW